MGYKFVGWYLGEERVTEETVFTPEKGEDGLYAPATYTAKFELAVVDLTISTTCSDSSQSFIFTISGTPSDPAYGTITLQVVLHGTDSVTIKNLPVGTYSVSELGGWSWRQSEPAATGVFTLMENKSFSFGFDSRNIIYWLSGYSYERKKGGS